MQHDINVLHIGHACMRAGANWLTPCKAANEKPEKLIICCVTISAHVQIRNRVCRNKTFELSTSMRFGWYAANCERNALTKYDPQRTANQSRLSYLDSSGPELYRVSVATQALSVPGAPIGATFSVIP